MAPSGHEAMSYCKRYHLAVEVELAKALFGKPIPSLKVARVWRITRREI